MTPTAATTNRTSVTTLSLALERRRCGARRGDLRLSGVFKDIWIKIVARRGEIHMTPRSFPDGYG